MPGPPDHHSSSPLPGPPDHHSSSPLPGPPDLPSSSPLPGPSGRAPSEHQDAATSARQAPHGPHGAAYFHQIRRKLRWQLLVAYVLPLLLLSAFFHLQYTRSLKEGVNRHLMSVAENKRNTVSLFLQERVANTRSVFHFSRLPAPPPTQEMAQVLAKLRRESPTFVDLGLFDPQGTLVAYTGPFPSLLGKNYGQEPWFQQLQKTSKGYHISDLFLGFRERPHFIIAVRKTFAGQEWTLRVSVDPEKFTSIVRRSILMKKVEVFIVNQQGVRQTIRRGAHPTQESALVPAPGPETRVVERETGRTTYLTAFAWLAEANWALVVRIPTAMAYAPIRQVRLVLMGIMVVLLLLIVLLTTRSTNKIVARLEAAVRAKDDLQQQLFNAAKLASVGEMAAGVAHEINNPLAIIYEEAGAMKDTLDPQFHQQLDLDDFAERIDAITEAAIRGRNITSKLLAFARKHDPDPQPTDLNDLLDKVLSIKATEFKVSNIQVQRRFQPGLPLLLVNPNQMEQVLLNLLNNAKDAMEGAGTITMTTERFQDHLAITVTDTGCGMSSDALARVFFPFFTTKGVGKGTGLGLSISYGIIKALGGNIEAQSREGHGSTFTVTLPLSLAVPAQPSAGESSPQPPETLSGTLS